MAASSTISDEKHNEELDEISKMKQEYEEREKLMKEKQHKLRNQTKSLFELIQGVEQQNKTLNDEYNKQQNQFINQLLMQLKNEKDKNQSLQIKNQQLIKEKNNIIQQNEQLIKEKTNLSQNNNELQMQITELTKKQNDDEINQDIDIINGDKNEKESHIDIINGNKKENETEIKEDTFDENKNNEIYRQIKDNMGKTRKPNKKKPKKKIGDHTLIVSEWINKLNTKTKKQLYTKFKLPLYSEEKTNNINIAQKKKIYDEKKWIKMTGLKEGCIIQLKHKNLEATVKYIGECHFSFGIVIGVKVKGNGNGRNSGDIDKIQYFKCPKNCGIFIKPDSIQKILSFPIKPDRKRGGSAGLNNLKASTTTIIITRQRSFSADSTSTISSHNSHSHSQSIDDKKENNEIKNDIEYKIDFSKLNLNKSERERLEKLHSEIGGIKFYLGIGDVIDFGIHGKGILHWIGDVVGKKGVQFGVELLDTNKKGKHNGMFNNIQYFECEDERGRFFPTKKVQKKVPLINRIDEEW